MGIVSGGGGTFNGGTITQPLTIDASDLRLDGGAGTARLRVTSTPFQQVDINSAGVSTTLDIDNWGGAGDMIRCSQSGTRRTTIYSTGRVEIKPTTGDDALDAFSDAGALAWRVLYSGQQVIREPHSAPADASLAAGDCALWFDQTNGAAKLMVKAKQADGTVKTASIALA